MAAAKKPRKQWKKVGEIYFGEGADGLVTTKIVTPGNTYYLHACDFTPAMKRTAFKVEESKLSDQRKFR